MLPLKGISMIFLHDGEFRNKARILLISTYFQAAERAALYALANMAAPDDDEIAKQIDFESLNEAEQKAEKRDSGLVFYTITTSFVL